MVKRDEPKAREKIRCFGHKNVSAEHESTFEITKDEEIGESADCIICTNSDKGAIDLSQKFKEKASEDDAKMVAKFFLVNGSDEEPVLVVEGEGDTELSYEHGTDLVGRTSSYTCSRTLMINSDYSSADFPREFIESLKNSEKELKVILEVH